MEYVLYTFKQMCVYVLLFFIKISVFKSKCEWKEIQDTNFLR